MIELDIPMRYIDFGRLLSTLGSGSLPLLPDIETWLADNGIACGVSAPWRRKGYIATFATQADASLFKLRWL